MDTNSKENNYVQIILMRVIEHVWEHMDIIGKVNFYFLEKTKVEDINNILAYLNNLFGEIESYIDKHQNEKSEILNFEYEVRNFAKDIFVILWDFWDELKGNARYRFLISQRHIAYNAYYSLYRHDISSVKIQEDKQLLGKMYGGLAIFYEHSNGYFKDNEEAIDLLCNFYPEVLPEFLTEEKIAQILYSYISVAGISGDIGFTYQGIQLIEKNIKKLPETVREYLLMQYQISDIAYRDIYRRQIIAIINNSSLSAEQKRNMKFQSLDIPVLVNSISQMVVNAIVTEYNMPPYFYLGDIGAYWKKSIEISKIPHVYWKKDNIDRNQLFVGADVFLEIKLKFIENNVYKIKVKNYRNGKEIHLSFQEESWSLDYLLSKKTMELLDRVIADDENTIEYKHMFFSLLYLDRYRGIRNQEIDFEHDFCFDSKNRVVKNNTLLRDKIPHFYGNKIHSLSCIVGKNGTGKTSIVDFLRETFFRLVKLIQMGIVACENGYVKEESYQGFEVLDKGAKFLIVFKLDAEAYFLTNIREVKVTDIKPFRREVYFNDNEFSKIVYFSNMLKSNQRSLYEDHSKNIKKRENEGIALAESLEEFRRIDYSETDSFIRRRRGLEGDRYVSNHIVNRDLCYQFTFLKNISKEKLQEYLDLDEEKIFYIKSNQLGEKSFSLIDLKSRGEKKLNELKSLEQEYIYLSDAWISYFSSGQYAKFTFLSKLYWFLEGYVKEKEYYNSFIDINEFSMKEVLEEDDTAFIFIDEGELFYHPEWQRRYIYTLLEMINSTVSNVKLQIVITTNSPFILSDVLKEDVIYLNKEQNVDMEYDSPLGQNIHKLLKDNFFMDYTIGEYGRRLIDNLIEGLQMSEGKNKKILRECLKQYFDDDVDEVFAVRRLINKIGEPIYRQSLEELAEEYFEYDQEKEIQYIEEKIKILQLEVKRKRGEISD